MLTEFFTRLTPRARAGFAAGVAIVLAITVAAAVWLLRTNDQVLFADLNPQDAAAMAAELDRQKIAYRVSPDGGTLLVDASIVHATRLKLMGKDIPLHGTAGFELFSSGDFGMTEFAQKVNYQRALQGEITRTILSLAEVKDARVHLALPEEGLFKRAESRPKAAITVGLKPGKALRPDQVNGIQRLVAGSVPGITAQDVTIVDQQGVALTRPASADAAPEGAAAPLDLKRDMEKLLARKATDVLERAFGEGQAMATVDVTLNMDQIRTTTEDLVSAPGAAGQAPTGVVVREREVVRDLGAPLAQDGAQRSGNSQREVDYQVGKRVEQVVTQPGALRRLHVAAVVRAPLDAQQLEQAKVLLAAAVGSLPERGDTVVIQSLAAFASPPASSELRAPPVEHPEPAPVSARFMGAAPWDIIAIGCAGVAALLVVLRLRARDRRGAQVLSAVERQRVLSQLQLWLDASGRPDVQLPPAKANTLEKP